MKSGAQNPYEALPVSGRAKVSHGKQWTVMIDGIDRDVVLNHSKMGMATTIYIDNELVFEHGNRVTITPSADIPLKYGSSDLLITIRDKTIGSEYAIWVNGQLLDGEDHSTRSLDSERDRWQLQSAIFMVVVAPVLYLAFGTSWNVGPIRGDIFAALLFTMGVFGLLKRLLSKRAA